MYILVFGGGYTCTHMCTFTNIWMSIASFRLGMIRYICKKLWQPAWESGLGLALG